MDDLNPNALGLREQYDLDGRGSPPQPFAEQRELTNLLALRVPGRPEETPPVFFFQRQREVEIKWSEVYGADADPRESMGSVEPIRRYFERSWGLPAEPNDAALSDLLFKAPTSNGDGLIRQIGGEVTDPRLAAQLDAWRTEFQGEESATPVGVKITEGVIFRHRSSGRRYLVLTASNETLTIDDFKTAEKYAVAWRTKITGVEIVFETNAHAEKYCVQFSEIDLRPGIIARRYSELKIMLDFAQALSSGLPPIDQDKVAALINSGADAEEISKLQHKYARIRMDQVDVLRELQRLASIAENMGLILCLDTRQIKQPDGVVITTLEPGKVYKPYQRTVAWTTTHQRPERRRSWFFGISYTQSVTFTQGHLAVVTDYEPVDTAIDHLTRWRDDYLAANPGNEVHVFRQAGKQFVAADGSPLRAVMERCDLDETFRRRCVALLPVFEESLTGERVLVKYDAFEHPLPGVAPAIMPRLTLEEALSYRTVWGGVVLGELANTINLAPGEQRTVHLVKQFQEEAETSRTAVSVFDVNRADSSDLATSMERIARQEREKSTNLQVSTSASGGGFGVTASASASSGVNTSAKEFGQAIGKVAKKAAQAVTQQNREEVSSSSSLRTKVTTTDETTAEIRNINEGRTLNLMFYRLYNRYTGGLYIEGLQFNLLPGVESIAGSGVFEAETYSIGQTDRLLDRLGEAPLPFDLDSDGQLRLREAVLREVFDLLKTEYGEEEEDAFVLGGEAAAEAEEGEDAPERRDRSVSVLPMARAGVAQLTSFLMHEKASPRDSVAVQRSQKELDETLRTAVANLSTTKSIEPVELIVGSGGLYLDSRVGALPSTEPYSEAMRTRAIEMRDAEIFSTRSEGLLRQAQARRIASLVGDAGGVCLTSISPDRNQWRHLAVGLNTAVPTGKWQLQVDGEVKARAPTTQKEEMIEFSWEDSQARWLTAPDLYLKVALVDPESGTEIRFLRAASERQVD